jgi:hypothetical protein
MDIDQIKAPLNQFVKKVPKSIGSIGKTRRCQEQSEQGRQQGLTPSANIMDEFKES